MRERWPRLVVVDTAGPPQPAGDIWLEIVPTPGHSPDHLCFYDRHGGDLYCGDLARKGGTIVIPSKKGGDLRAYLASLNLVRELAPTRLLPGHGPIVDDPIALIDQYIAHRAHREQQILKAMLEGARTVDEIVRKVYPALPASLSEAAADSVRAHLAKLRDDGESLKFGMSECRKNRTVADFRHFQICGVRSGGLESRRQVRRAFGPLLAPSASRRARPARALRDRRRTCERPSAERR